MPTIKQLLADETLWYMVILGWFIFIGINVNTTIGLLYYSMTVGAIFLSVFDEKKTIKFDKDGKWISAIISAGIIYIAFIMLSIFLSPIFEKINLGGILSLLGATAPALAQSKILNFITFTIPVGFVETMSFIRFKDYIATRLNIRIDKNSLFTISTLALTSFFAFVFMLLHITAKGITNNVALMLVFTMMFISLNVAIWFGEGKQAVLFHMIANGIAMSVLVGLFSVGVI